MNKFAAKPQTKTRGLMWILYGVAGVGKTEQALALHGLLNTYLINLDLGADHVEDAEGNKPVGISRLETDADGNLLLPDLTALYQALAYLETTTYKAVCIDSSTQLFNYILGHVNNKRFDYVSEGGWENKNKAVEESNKVVAALRRLQEKGMDVIITGHDKKSAYNDPMQDKPYDRWTLDSPHEPMAQVFIRAADNVAFCHYEIEKTSETKSRVKMSGDGTRVMLLENRPWAPDCKNRSSLPEKIEMTKDASGLRAALAAASQAKGKTFEQVKAEVEAMLKIAPKAVQENKAIQIAVAKASEMTEVIRLKSKLSELMAA